MLITIEDHMKQLKLFTKIYSIQESKKSGICSFELAKCYPNTHAGKTTYSKTD